jgi:uncharacterized protein YggE
MNTFYFKAFIIACFLVSGSLCDVFAQEKGKRLLYAQGDGVVKVKPSEVILSVGVTSRGEDITKTKLNNSTTIKRAISICNKKGISGKNIQTTLIDIRPQYKDYEAKATNYIVSQSMSIIIDNPNIYDELVTELINAGVNQISGATLSVSDKELEKLKQQALSLAIENAKAKALLLSKAINLSLGEIVTVSEQGIDVPLQRMGGLRALSSIASDSSISLGVINIRASVILIFEII